MFPTSYSSSNHGAPIIHCFTCSGSNSCAWNPSVQVCHRSPQHPAAYNCSATSRHAAGKAHISFWTQTRCNIILWKLNSDVNLSFCLTFYSLYSFASLLLLSRDRSLWLPPCWLLPRHTNRSRCSVNDGSNSFDCANAHSLPLTTPGVLKSWRPTKKFFNESKVYLL